MVGADALHFSYFSMTLYQVHHSPFLQRYFTTISLIGSVLLAAFVTDLKAQDAFERGKSFYEQRHAEADSFHANPTYINKAIEAFEEAVEQDINPQESAAYLLQSYYYKGMYGGVSEDQQKEIYDKGRALGEKMMDRFPDAVPIKFWYGANVGRWADVHGFVKAATGGVAKKLRRVCNDIIELDPNYLGGGGYRILAQVHFFAPSIPLLMGWPSDKKALELVEKAMSIAPEHPTNRMLYAQILLEFDRKKEAKKQLQFIQNIDPRPTHLVEDRYVQHRSRKLFSEHFKN